jgi:tetratricopeptide (TPR) repeat protein
MAMIRNCVLPFLRRRSPIILLFALLLCVGAHEIFVRGHAYRVVVPTNVPAQHASPNNPDAGYQEGSWTQSLKDLPWQLVVTRRQFAPKKAVNSISADIEFEHELPSTCNVFFVPITSHDGGTNYYFGAITNCDGMRKGEEFQIDLGHAFIFSRWGDKNPASCRPASGGYYLASDHEGNHVSVRLRHPWGKGRYTFSLRVLTNDADTSPELWVGAYVYSHRDKVEYYVGALRFPSPAFNFSGYLGSMVEVYDRYPRAFPKSIPSARVSIGNVRVNEELQKPLAVTAEYEKGAPRRARAERGHEASEELRRSFPDDPAAVILSVGNNVFPPLLGSKHEKPADANPNIGDRPTDEECHELAKEVEKSVRAGNVAEFARLFGVTEKLLVGFDQLQATTAEQFQLLFIDVPGIAVVVARRIVDEIGRRDTYRLVHIHYVENRPRALYRFWNFRAACWDYHDCSLARKPNGDLRVSDVTFVAAGSTLSEVAQRLCLALLPADQPRSATSGRFAGGVGGQDVITLRRRDQLISQGKYDEALKAHQELSPSRQLEKRNCIVRVHAARHIHGDEYTKAIENLRALYPNDVSTHLLSIDYFVRSSQFDKALTAVDRTDAILGGDPAMDEVRGRVHLSAGSLAKARESFARAIDREPTLAEAYWGILSVTLQEKKFDETVEWLKKVEVRFHPMVGDLTTRPEYAEFVKSPQYRVWLQWQKEYLLKHSPPNSS